MQRLYTIAEKKRRPNWNCCCTSFEVLHPLRLVDPEKKSRHYFLEDFLWQLSFWGDFLGLDPPLYVVVALLFETLFWRGANKHIWQDLVRHMIAVKSRTLQPLRVQVTRYAMCDKYGSCGFSTSFSFPHSWNMRIGAADTGNCKNWIKRVENKWFPNVLLLLHTLYFSECEKEGESKAKNCIRRSLFWERGRSGVFLHWWCFLHQDLCSTCWNFCFHPGFFSTFSGSFIKGVLWFRSHWTCEENNAVPKGPLSGKLTSIAYHRASFSFVDSGRTKGNFVEGKTTTFAKVSAISPHAG